MTLELTNRVSTLRKYAVATARHARDAAIRVVALFRRWPSSLVAFARDVATRVVALLRLWPSSLVVFARDAATRVVALVRRWPSSLAAFARDSAARIVAPLRLSSLRVLAADAARRVVPALGYQVVPTVAALALLVVCMGGRWHLASASPKGSSLAHASASVSPPARSPPASGPHAGSGSPAGGVAFDDGAPPRPVKKSGKDLSGALNLNTATEDQLMLLPTVGPAKAERIVTWRKKNGGFRRIADLRRVKGFGYKTFKRLEPWLAVTGDTTLH